MVFRLKKKDKNYAQVHVNMLRDKSLTLKAKGLGAVLEAYSDEFQVSLKSIELGSRDGKKALKTAIKELENGYYLFRFQTRDEQGLFVTYWAFDSERLDVAYLREIVTELEKVELITQSDILSPGYQKGTPVTGVPLSGPRSSGPRSRAPYKNNPDKNNWDKNTLSTKTQETRETFSNFKERIKRDFAGKVITNCIPGYRAGIELRMTGAELLQIHGNTLDKVKAGEIWDWLACNKHMVGYMLPAATVQCSELKLEFAGRTVLVPIQGKPTYAVAKDFEPAGEEGLFTLTLEFEHNGKPSLGSTAPKSADEWVQWFAQQQHNSFERPTYTAPPQITAGAKKIKSA